MKIVDQSVDTGQKPICVHRKKYMKDRLVYFSFSLPSQNNPFKSPTLYWEGRQAGHTWQEMGGSARYCPAFPENAVIHTWLPARGSEGCSPAVKAHGLEVAHQPTTGSSHPCLQWGAIPHSHISGLGPRTSGTAPVLLGTSQGDSHVSPGHSPLLPLQLCSPLALFCSSCTGHPEVSQTC